jgi:hypothetical protein
MCNCDNSPKNPVQKVKRVIREIRNIWTKTNQKNNDKKIIIKPLKK